MVNFSCRPNLLTSARHDGPNRIAVLGSTGSIGTSSLEVIRSHPAEMALLGVTAHQRWKELAAQAREFAPRWAVVTDPSQRGQISGDAFSAGTKILFGEEGVEFLASHDDVDTVVTGIVGAAGLRGSWAAAAAGKRLAVANKETLVVAGPLIGDLAEKSGATLIPVDSEHSAIFQSLHAGNPNEVRRLVLTASGGPFRGWSKSQLASVTPADALAHPTWEMGRKITIDCATMMNKALEIIEAKWLFGLGADQIDVVVHPQSIVHSFVEFVDGSVIAQLSPPDMKLPIQYALTYPKRTDGPSPRMDWTSPWDLRFEPPDIETFPALGLGFEVAASGGTAGAVLNAANEVAVERFLNAELQFCDIPTCCRSVLNAHDFDPSPSLDALMRQDQWAREEARRWTCSM